MSALDWSAERARAATQQANEARARAELLNPELALNMAAGGEAAARRWAADYAPRMSETQRGDFERSVRHQYQIAYTILRDSPDPDEALVIRAWGLMNAAMASWRRFAEVVSRQNTPLTVLQAQARDVANRIFNEAQPYADAVAAAAGTVSSGLGWLGLGAVVLGIALVVKK